MYKSPVCTSPTDRPTYSRLAAALVLLDGLGAEVDARFASLCPRRGLSLHTGLDLGRHGEESLLDVGAGLGRGLQEFDPERVGELLALLGADDPLRREVGFIAHEELVDVLGGVPVDLVQPLLHVVERLGIRHVVHHDDAVRSAVVRRRDRPEPLLSGRVPNLELNRLLVEFNGADFL